MDLVGDLGNAKALQPLVDKAIAEASDQLAAKVAPAIGEAVKNALAGLKITITVERA